MLKKVCIALLALTCLPLGNLSFAQPKVVPIGETIKPEGGGTTQGTPAKAKKKKQASRSVLQAGKSFIVESVTVLSSSLNTEGDTVYFRAVENVAGVIAVGALAQGKLVTVENDRKHGKLVIQLESINAVNGQSVNLGGDITIEGKGAQASLAVGEKFTAVVDEKTVVRGKAKKGEAVFPTFEKQGFAEVRPPEVKANLKKGTYKAMIEVIIEAPKGLSVADLDSDSVVLYGVNDHALPQEINSVEGRTKKGDKNKNGVTDLSLMFDGWNFIKYQPRGTNTVYFKGKLKDGTEYGASAKVAISY